MATDHIELIVNGEPHRVSSRSDTPLLEVLRSELGLLGAKHACGAEQCGACKVLVDGEDQPSCCQPVGEIAGSSIQTVEGLAADDRLDPLQEAFIAETATQCGYCVPGFLMAAKGLLHRNPNPSEKEIREAINRNLCRCGIHNRVVRAIQRVAFGTEAEPIYKVVPPADGLAPPTQERGAPLPGSLAHHPDLDDWIRLRPDRGVDVYTGKVELGQGITTSLSQVVAEELDVDITRIRIHTADTETSLDEGSTAGSMSMEMSGGALRQAAAEFRYQLLAIAAEEFECDQEDLEVSDGMVQHPASGSGKDYWDLLPEGRLGMAATGVAVPKPPVAYSVVGQPVTRVDMESRVRGEPVFLQDMVLPNTLHARVVRGPVAQASLERVDTTGLNLPDGVRLVRDGSFLAVMGEDEIEVLRARELVAARCSWHTPDRLPDQQDLYSWMNAQESQDFLLRDGQPSSDPIPEPPEGDGVIHRTFHRPYQMHAAPGPSCAIAQLDEIREADRLVPQPGGVQPAGGVVAGARQARGGDPGHPCAGTRLLRTQRRGRRGPGCLPAGLGSTRPAGEGAVDCARTNSCRSRLALPWWWTSEPPSMPRSGWRIGTSPASDTHTRDVRKRRPPAKPRCWQPGSAHNPWAGPCHNR